MYDARSMTQVVSFPKKQYIQTSCDISNDNRYLVSILNQLSFSIDLNRCQQVMDLMVVDLKYL
jgi:hypothetical protein